MMEETTEKKINLEIASKLNRLGAFLIDMVFLSVLTLIALIILGAFSKETPVEVFKGLVYVVRLIFFLIYFPSFTIAWGATPGKKILKMRVVNLKGEKTSVGRIILRETLGKLLSIVVLGSLWLFFNKQNREAWDFLAGTIVIKDKV
jgi:uncharacterized RDD family membrane protein YckC